MRAVDTHELLPELDGFSLRINLQQREPGDELLRFSERAIDHGALRAGVAYARALRGWLQALAPDDLASLHRLLHQLSHRFERPGRWRNTRLGVGIGLHEADEPQLAWRRLELRPGADRFARRCFLVAPPARLLRRINREVLGFFERADLDLTILERHALRPVDRVLERSRLNNPITCDELLHLCERTVGDGDLPVVVPHARALGARLHAVRPQ